MNLISKKIKIIIPVLGILLDKGKNASHNKILIKKKQYL